MLLNKGPPRKITVEDMSDALAAPHIITPHALPMYRDIDPGRGTKRKRDKDRMDPKKSRRPELPVTGPGKGGRVGASATQHIVQNLVRDTTRDEDVRTCLPLRLLCLFGVGGNLVVCRGGNRSCARGSRAVLAEFGQGSPNYRWIMISGCFPSQRFSRLSLNKKLIFVSQTSHGKHFLSMLS